MMLAEKPRSPVSEHRKVTKSAMEKKRRARINSSLTELKTILAGIMAFKDERFEKMEKADILEMTVNYVRQLQNKSLEKDKHTNVDSGDYSTGVNSCIGEVIRYVTSSDICDTDTKTKLLDHLANKVNNVPTTPPRPIQQGVVTSPVNPTNNKTFTVNVPDTTTADTNNNNVTIADNNISQSQFKPISIYTTQMPLNSVQTIGAYQPQMVSPVNSIQTAISVPNVQNVTQVSQAPSQVMQNVPLTILVPANFCTTAAGTTCVIPLTLANSGTEPTNAVLNTNTCARENDCNLRRTPDSPCDSSSPRLSPISQQNKEEEVPDRCPNMVLNLVHSSKDNESRHVPRNSVNNDGSNVSERLVSRQIHNRHIELDSTSENMSFPSKSPKSPDFIRSEHSVFQKYQSLKAPSPFNRMGPVWRPW